MATQSIHNARRRGSIEFPPGAAAYLECYWCGDVAFWLKRAPEIGDHLAADDALFDDGRTVHDGELVVCQHCGTGAVITDMALIKLPESVAGPSGSVGQWVR